MAEDKQPPPRLTPEDAEMLAEAFARAFQRDRTLDRVTTSMQDALLGPARRAEQKRKDRRETVQISAAVVSCAAAVASVTAAVLG